MNRRQENSSSAQHGRGAHDHQHGRHAVANAHPNELAGELDCAARSSSLALIDPHTGAHLTAEDLADLDPRSWVS